MRAFMSLLPKWVVLLLSVALVVAIGIIDYLTGDYSLLIFYLVPVSLGGWYAGRWGGVAIAAIAGIARFASDYATFTNTSLMYWNCFEDVIFLVVVVFLITTVKRLLKGDVSDPAEGDS